MAKIVDYKIKQAQAATTHQVNLPNNVEDDVVLVIASQDGTISSAFTINESFTIHQQDYYTAEGRMVIAYKVAGAGGITTAPTITSATSAEWTSTTVIVRGADTADIFEAISTATTDAVAYTVDTPTVTTVEDNCLIINATANFSSLREVIPEPVNAANWHYLVTHQTDNFGGASIAVNWSWQKTAGTTSAETLYAEGTVRFLSVTFAINDSGDGYIPGYVDPATEPSKLIDPIRNTAFPIGGGSIVNMSSIIPTIHSKSSVNAVSSVSYYSGYNPFGPETYFGANTSGIAPYTYKPTALTDFTWGNGLFYCVIKATEAESVLYENTYASGGVSFLIYDDQADEEYITWKIASGDSKRKTTSWLPILIQVDNAQNTDHETYLTPNLTNIEGMAIMNETTLQTNYISVAYYTLLNKLVCAGGSSTVPIDYAGLWSLLSHTSLPYAERLGEKAFLSYIPIVFGGGNEVHIDIDGLSLQFPKSFDASTLDLNVHIAENKLGLTFDGNTGDTINMTNCLISGATKFHFAFASGVAGTYDLSGTTVSNAGTVTLRDLSQDLSGLTFSECDKITLNDCALTDTTITKSTDTIALNIDDATECADLANLTFTDNTNGHSIELGATGTYTFDNFKFNGGGSGGTSTADVLNDTGGAITINITNGGDTPTIKNGTGASTTVQNSVTVTVTAKDEDGNAVENARVLLEKVSDGTDILTGLTNASGVATTSFAFTSTTAVTGWVRKSSSSPYYKQAILAGSITSSGYDVTVTMVSDE